MKDPGDKLLREYVHCILSEDSADMAAAGISAADVSAAAGPGGGYASGSKGDMWNTFITPFTDVTKTAIGKSKEIVRRGWTVVNVAIRTVLTTLIPGIGENYKAVFEKEKSDLDKIRSKYKDVYDRTNKALSSTDAVAFAFMASPKSALAGLAASKSPAVTKEVLSALTGGISDEILEGRLSDRFPDLGSNIERFLRDFEVSAERKSKFKKESVSDKFLVLMEDDKKESEELLRATKEILKSPKFIGDVLKDPRVKDKLATMQKDFSDTNRRTLKKIYGDAVSVLGSSASLEALEKISRKTSAFDEIKKLSGDERKKAEDEILKNSKAAIKNFYVKMMKDKINDLKKDGIPEESQYVRDYLTVIEKIEKL